MSVLLKSLIFQPYDYMSLVDIEREGLKSMLRYFKSIDTFDNIHRYVTEIKTCIDLLDIVIAGQNSYDYNIESDTCITDVYVNTRNANRFIKNYTYNFNKPIMKIWLRAEKAWYLYNKIRTERMRNWYTVI